MIDRLTQAESIELVQDELGLTTLQAVNWLRKHFGAVAGISRAEVLAHVAKTKRMLSLRTHTWDNDDNDTGLQMD